MQLVPVDDMNFLAQQSSGKLNMIISGMTALMNDNDSKVAQLESQNWFQRMVRTIRARTKRLRPKFSAITTGLTHTCPKRLRNCTTGI